MPRKFKNKYDETDRKDDAAIGPADSVWNNAIMIYQSFSGDADSGNSHFTMNGGSLANRQGHLFHVTNTNAIITLNGVTLGNDCTWTLTADTYITSLKGDTSHIKANGHRLFVNGKEMKIYQ